MNKDKNENLPSLFRDISLNCDFWNEDTKAAKGAQPLLYKTNHNKQNIGLLAKRFTMKDFKWTSLWIN